MTLILKKDFSRVHDPATGAIHAEPIRLTPEGSRRGGQTACGLASETWNQRLGVAVDCNVCEAVQGLP